MYYFAKNIAENRTIFYTLVFVNTDFSKVLLKYISGLAHLCFTRCAWACIFNLTLCYWNRKEVKKINTKTPYFRNVLEDGEYFGFSGPTASPSISVGFMLKYRLQILYQNTRLYFKDGCILRRYTIKFSVQCITK